MRWRFEYSISSDPSDAPRRWRLYLEAAQPMDRVLSCEEMRGSLEGHGPPWRMLQSIMFQTRDPVEVLPWVEADPKAGWTWLRIPGDA